MAERAIILCDGDSIGWENFRFSIPGSGDEAAGDSIQENNLDLAEIEKSVILKALKQANNNKSKAAELLNITWQSLDRRMEKHGIK